MRMFVKTPWRLCAAVLLIVGATFDGTIAKADDDEDLGRWVPAFSIQVGLNAQNAEGHIGTTDVLGPPAGSPPPVPLQPLMPGTPVTSRDRMMTPYAGASLELMTPAWFDVPTRPRAFAHADVAVAFGPTYVMPSVGDIGPIRFPTPGSPINELTLLGQGAKNEATVGPLLVFAGVGIALTTHVGDRTLRIKPSFEYVREEIEHTGLMQRAVQLNSFAPSLSDYRFVQFNVSQTYVYHGIGPGLELELETGRAGPFVVSLFGTARGWAFVSNQKQNLVARNEYGEEALYTFLKNKWAFGGSLGLRFRWVPE